MYYISKVKKTAKKPLHKHTHHPYNETMDPDPTPSIPVPPNRGIKDILNRPPAVALLVILSLASIGYLIYSFAGPGGYNIFQKPAAIPEQTKKPKGLTFAPQLLSPASPAAGASASASLKCPINPIVCQNRNAFKESSFSAQLTKDSKLFASFNGTITSLPATHPTSTGEEKFDLVILTNNKLGLQAMYSFKGTATTKTEVLSGEAIATVSGQPIAFMDNKSLVFYLIEATGQGGRMVPLSPTSFK